MIGTVHYTRNNKRHIIGITESVIVVSQGPYPQTKEVVARIDTGASKSSIDVELAAKLRWGPIFRTRLIKSAHGNSVRAIVKGTVILSGIELRGQFTIADRKHMKYSILIGRNLLTKGKYFIDPLKK